MTRLLTYNYFINKYIFNNQICKYNNSLPNKPKKFIFNTTDDVKNFIDYYHVKNHDFGDLNLADEITINDRKYNKTWLIAGFNTQLDADVKNGTFGKHHLTLIPKDYLFNKVRMHSKIDNSQGFANTEMLSSTLPEINNNLSNILQNHLLPHKMMLSIDNKVKMQSFTAKSMLLNYYQSFGKDLPYQHYIIKSGTHKGNNEGWYVQNSTQFLNGDFDNGDDVFQLPLFKQDVKYRTVTRCWWLRNIYSDSSFTTVNFFGHLGISHSNNDSSYNTIRPFICLG